jgi:hypothetical protein
VPITAVDSPAPSVAAIATREATAADDPALVRLAARCPMNGDVSLCVHREPEFFALERLEGDRWRAAVATNVAGEVIGCVAAAMRSAYLHGRPAHTAYACDLKVDPAYRGGAAADALTRFARAACAELGGPGVPTLVTVLAGNRPMERRALGARDNLVLARFATVRAHAIPLLWHRRLPDESWRIPRATWNDLEEMIDLWRRVAPTRQLAPVLDAERLRRWIDAAPGLDIGDYRVARGRDGRIAAFLALWDQSSFKQLRVTGYSRRLRAVRLAFNALAPRLGATPLPKAGGVLRMLAGIHPCVRDDDPAILHALLRHTYAELRSSGYSFFTVSLDVRDPLAAALDGFLPQPTDVGAYSTTPRGRYDGRRLDDRPLYYDTALV